MGLTITTFGAWVDSPSPDNEPSTVCSAKPVSERLLPCLVPSAITTTAGISSVLGASVVIDCSLPIGLVGQFLVVVVFGTISLSGRRSTIIFPIDVFECER